MGKGSGGSRGGVGGANIVSFAIMYIHATHGEMCNYLNCHCELTLAVAMRAMTNRAKVHLSSKILNDTDGGCQLNQQ